MYIVYATSGDYDDYGVDGVYVGDRDPKPLLDGIALRISEGKFQTFDRYVSPFSDSFKQDREMQSRIFREAIPTLERHGFKKAEATEVWLG